MAGIYYTLGIVAYAAIYFQNKERDNTSSGNKTKRKGNLTYLNVTPMRMNTIRETTIDMELEYAAN